MNVGEVGIQEELGSQNSGICCIGEVESQGDEKEKI